MVRKIVQDGHSSTNGDTKLRVTCLDGGSDFDVISQQVVNDLGLQSEEYTGEAARPVGGASYNPEGYITLDWHVSGRVKTYKTKFTVFNTAYSEDFDVLLGRHTIKRIGFYKKNGDIWWLPADESRMGVS